MHIFVFSQVPHGKVSHGCPAMHFKDRQAHTALPALVDCSDRHAAAVSSFIDHEPQPSRAAAAEARHCLHTIQSARQIQFHKSVTADPRDRVTRPPPHVARRAAGTRASGMVRLICRVGYCGPAALRDASSLRPVRERVMAVSRRRRRQNHRFPGEMGCRLAVPE